MQRETIEETLAETERLAEAAAKAASAAAGQLRKVRTACKTGQVRELRKALAAAGVAAEKLNAAVRVTDEAFDVDEQAYLASGEYTKELLLAATAAGVSMSEEDERLLCYPSLIRLLPGEAAVEVDRVREKRLRPSVLVARMAAAQERPPRFNPERFCDSLRAAYDLVVARQGTKADAVVRLVDVWGVLTLLPGQSSEYTKPEFARDLYLLDQAGVISTGKDQRRLRWAASSGTRTSGVLTTVAKDGRQQRYWGLAFVEAPS